MPSFINLTGQRFGKWTVLSKASNGKGGKVRWFCRCECGRKRIVQGNHLRTGNSKGCKSCQISRKNLKHGQYGTRLYLVWRGMIERCENPSTAGYKYYGGRGIQICAEWRKDFKVFRKWALEHGYKEVDVSDVERGKRLGVDRINNGGDYSPDNCQILTFSENVIKGNKERVKSTSQPEGKVMEKSIGSNFSNSNAPGRYPG